MRTLVGTLVNTDEIVTPNGTYKLPRQISIYIDPDGEVNYGDILVDILDMTCEKVGKEKKDE